MHESVDSVAPEPDGASIPRFRGLRITGAEAPLRSAIEDGERLLVCASVRFSDRSAGEPLWLTDRRFLFIRQQSTPDNRTVSVPISNCTLKYEAASPYPLRLSWIDGARAPATEAFRAKTWKDNLSRGSGPAVAGATGGIEAAVIVAFLEKLIASAVGTDGQASLDGKLFATLTAALRAPAQFRPIDLSAGSLNTRGSRVLIALTTGIPTAALLASAVYAAISYQSLQAYEAAPICATPAVTDCRRQDPVVITSYRGTVGKDDFCDLTLRRPDGSTVIAELLGARFCSQPLNRKAMIIESWRGSITMVIPPDEPPAETGSSPAYNWLVGRIFTGITGLIWLLFGIVGLVEFRGWLARRALLRARHGGATL